MLTADKLRCEWFKEKFQFFIQHDRRHLCTSILQNNDRKRGVYEMNKYLHLFVKVAEKENVKTSEDSNFT